MTECLDRDEVINLKVAQLIESLPAGITISDRLMAMEVNALRHTKSIGDYLNKLFRFGWLTVADQPGKYKKTKKRRIAINLLASTTFLVLLAGCRFSLVPDDHKIRPITEDKPGDVPAVAKPWYIGEEVVVATAVAISTGLGAWWTNRQQKKDRREYHEKGVV